jgi:hypothetical protein
MATLPDFEPMLSVCALDADLDLLAGVGRQIHCQSVEQRLGVITPRTVC